MKHKKTLQALILTSFGVMTLGCASLGFTKQPTIDINELSYSYDDIPAVYNYRYEGRDKQYYSHLSIPEALYDCAGVTAGTLEATDKDYLGGNGGGNLVYITDGFFNRMENPEALMKVLVESDTNFDYHITRDEALFMYNEVMKNSLRDYQIRKQEEYKQALEAEEQDKKIFGIF